MSLPPHLRTGRNDPCPCGSGKKYKHCCLKLASASDDSPWRQQRDASGRLAQEMLNFARQNFARDLDAAWLDFNQDDAPSRSKKIQKKARYLFPIFCSTGTPNHAPAGARRSRALSHNPIYQRRGTAYRNWNG
jgi:hypothetical protein